MSNKIDVNKIAKLARLKLTQEESLKLAEYLEQIVDYMDQLNQLDTSKVEPTSHILPMQNVFREDKILKSSNKNYLVASAANNKDHYEVPKII